MENLPSHEIRSSRTDSASRVSISTGAPLKAQTMAIQALVNASR